MHRANAFPLVPLLLILVVGYVSTFFMMPRIDWDAITTMQAEQMKARNSNVSQEDLDRMDWSDDAAWRGVHRQIGHLNDISPQSVLAGDGTGPTKH